MPKGQTRETCECPRRELSGEPDAGNPHVRFDEGGVGRMRWYAVAKAQKGKPGNRAIPKPKRKKDVTLSSTLQRSEGSLWSLFLQTHFLLKQSHKGFFSRCAPSE